MDAAFAAYRELRDSGVPEAAQSAQYCLPLGTRCRAMFKMDFAEALYISELRVRRRRPLQLSPRRLGDVQGRRGKSIPRWRSISGSKMSTSPSIC